jgi:DNA invertase Pin-like site-specific DNA recombinase
MADMPKPVAYLRKSKVDPGTRDASWEVQEAKVRALAARNGDADLEILSDWGRSGRGEKTRLRPEYKRLRAMIAAGEVSVLYSYSLSRLSRSLTEYASLAELCREHNVRVRLDKEGEIDYSSASGRAMVGILAVLAQMEAELAQERARDTIQARRARGDHVGSAGYGKRLHNGTLVDNPAEDLEAVVAAYREAGSLNGAARILNTGKVPSKFGKRWSGTTVRRVLATGAPSEVAARKVEPRVKQRGTFALSRLLRCPCGQLMTGVNGRGSRKYGMYGPYASYQCYRGRFEPDHPRPYMVSEREIMPWVMAEAARLRVPGDRIAATSEPSRRDDLIDRRRRVLDNYEDGLIDKGTRDAKLATIVADIEALETSQRTDTIPPAIDWSWEPSTLNDVLRALLSHIELGSDLRPVRAEWTVPEWRS